MTGEVIVAVDARPLARLGNGIARFVYQVARELERLPGIRLILCSPRELDPACRFERARVLVDRAWRRMPGTLWYMQRMHELSRRAGARVVWGTAHTLPLFRAPGIGTVLTIHDLVHVKFPHTMRPGNRWVSRLFFARSVGNADRIATVSHATLQELVFHHPEAQQKARTIYPGKTRLPPAEKPSGSPLPPYLYCLGSIEPRKNLAGLIEVFSHIAPRLPDLQLILTGADAWGDAENWPGIADATTRQKVIFTGPLPDSEIRHHLENAAAFVLPSKYEGFGLPILEAEGACPIVLSDIPVFQEIARHLDDVLLLDFNQPDEAARLLQRHLQQKPPATRLRQESLSIFDWKECAREYADLFRSAASDAS